MEGHQNYVTWLYHVIIIASQLYYQNNLSVHVWAEHHDDFFIIIFQLYDIHDRITR